MSVTNSIDCHDGELFVILAKTDVAPTPHPIGFFPDRKTRLAQCPSAAVTVSPGL
jgi:hypothetical protein